MVLSVFGECWGGAVAFGECWRVGVACVGSRCWRCVGIMSIAFAWVECGAVCVW
jgi:hypothetical protein